MGSVTGKRNSNTLSVFLSKVTVGAGNELAYEIGKQKRKRGGGGTEKTKTKKKRYVLLQ